MYERPVKNQDFVSQVSKLGLNEIRGQKKGSGSLRELIWEGLGESLTKLGVHGTS